MKPDAISILASKIDPDECELQMIPLAVPNLAGREGEYLQECVTSTFVSTVGPFVKRFETMVAEAAGSPMAVATSAGTTALHAGLVAVGVKPGDLVLLPSLTFIASANAVSHAGAAPFLLDVTSESWTLDPEQIEEALANCREGPDGLPVHLETGRRVSAILPVYTLGMPADMNPIIELARHYRLPVVADGAAALGATYRGRSLGQLGAALTMASFNGNKTVTAGGGGAVFGSDALLLDRVRHLTTTARVGADYDHDMIGFNYRMTNLQAAVGCAQMENFELFLSAKRRIAADYDKGFADLSSTSAFPSPSWAQSASWFSGLTINDGARIDMTVGRARLREAGIDARPFWRPMHFQAPYRDCPRSQMSVSENIWERVLTLPCSTNLTEADQAYVIDNVRSVFS